MSMSCLFVQFYIFHSLSSHTNYFVDYWTIFDFFWHQIDYLKFWSYHILPAFTIKHFLDFQKTVYLALCLQHPISFMLNACVWAHVFLKRGSDTDRVVKRWTFSLPMAFRLLAMERVNKASVDYWLLSPVSAWFPGFCFFFRTLVFQDYPFPLPNIPLLSGAQSKQPILKRCHCQPILISGLPHRCSHFRPIPTESVIKV